MKRVMNFSPFFKGATLVQVKTSVYVNTLYISAYELYSPVWIARQKESFVQTNSTCYIYTLLQRWIAFKQNYVPYSIISYESQS